MCAGLFHAPSGCRVAGTHFFHDTASVLDLEDVSGCMGSYAKVPCSLRARDTEKFKSVEFWLVFCYFGSLIKAQRTVKMGCDI